MTHYVRPSYVRSSFEFAGNEFQDFQLLVSSGIDWRTTMNNSREEGRREGSRVGIKLDREFWSMNVRRDLRSSIIYTLCYEDVNINSCVNGS